MFANEFFLAAPQPTPVLYRLSPDDEIEEILDDDDLINCEELGDCNECNDPECPCECHEDEDELDGIEGDEDELDGLESEDDLEESDDLEAEDE